MKIRNIQDLTNDFNQAYFKACNTSIPEDWLDAALAGRHLVNGLNERGLATDILPELQETRSNKK